MQQKIQTKRFKFVSIEKILLPSCCKVKQDYEYHLRRI